MSTIRFLLWATVAANFAVGLALTVSEIVSGRPRYGELYAFMGVVCLFALALGAS